MAIQADTVRRFKIIIVGESGVGKTSLMYRFCRNRFDPLNDPTIVNFESKRVQICGETVNLEIWDTAGQEKFFSVTTLYFRDSKGIVFVYDVTRPESLYNMEKWIDLAEKETSPNAVKVLVGHKCDDVIFKQISTEEGKAVADYFGMFFFEASSKEDIDVLSIFNCLATEVVDLYRKDAIEHEIGEIIRVVLPMENDKPENSYCCFK